MKDEKLKKYTSRDRSQENPDLVRVSVVEQVGFSNTTASRIY